MASVQPGARKTNISEQSVSPKLAAIIMYIIWTGVLATGVFLQHISLRLGIVFAWFVYNYVSWLVPAWRRAILSRRAANIGEGFAFAGALMLAIGVYNEQSVIASVGLFAASFCFLYAPFLLFRVVNVPACRPHWLDIAVGVYILIIAVRWPFSPLTTFGSVSIGTFAAAALCVTFFLAIRFWNRTDWSLRWPKRATRQVVLSSVVIVASGVILAVLFQMSPTVDFINLATSAVLLGPLTAMVVFGVIHMVVYERLTDMKASHALLSARVVSTLLYVAASAFFAPNNVLLMSVVGIAASLTVQRREFLSPVMVLSALGYVVSSIIA